METRANFVLIGAFTLIGILGSLAMFLWLAKVEIDRQYAYYDILFTDVSGLGEAGDVRYNGLPVGQVVRLALDDVDPSKVRIRIEIAADAPVKTDTIATLELQGVTGVSYVALSGGSPEAPRLAAAEGQRYPVIPSRKSAVQSLFEGGPELINKAIQLLEDLRETVGPENRAAVGNILANLDKASGELNSTLQDFSSLSADLSQAAQKLAGFTDKLDPVAAAAVTTLNTADETLRTAQEAIAAAQSTIGEATGTLASARQTFDAANGLIADQLPGLIGQAEATAGTIESVVADLGGKAGGVAERIDRLAEIAILRLTEAEATFARVDTALDAAAATMASIEQTSQSVNALVTGDGAALVADTRKAVAAANLAIDAASRMITEDLPGIIANVQSATANVDSVVSAVGEDLTGVTGKLGGIADNANTAITGATETFRVANETLTAITAAVKTAEATLRTAEQTFDGVNGLIEGDVSVIVGDVRQGVGNLNRALAQVADDLPAITGDVRQTLQRLKALGDSLNAIVTGNSDEIQVFMQAGLPQFVRFVKEASVLVANLQRLTAKIESDPARFLLGTQSPEFRR
ncbi:MAG TPA: MlaD family protein [Thermohalobaculum sp.]|nr:MlaD family protein [Thermohalobaculum sp.]